MLLRILKVTTSVGSKMCIFLVKTVITQLESSVQQISGMQEQQKEEQLGVWPLYIAQRKQ